MNISTPSLLAHRPIRGIALVLAAVVLFAAMDTAGKFLVTKFNVPLVVAIRYVINLALLAAILAPRHGAAMAIHTHLTLRKA